MEAHDVDGAELVACLHDLARANALTLARPPTLAFLARATRRLPKGDGFSLLDVGYGQGDMLRAIHRWAVRRGLRPNLEGVDRSPFSKAAAESATDPSLGIRFLVGDVFEHQPTGPVDFVVSSLVAHHMSDDDLVRFMRWMESHALRGWFINDLHRQPLAYYGFMVLSRVAFLHPMVRRDGLTSVARAFTRKDWSRLLAEAGFGGADVEVGRRFPYRICVARLK